ncbi:hypothetical protein ACM26V_06285 [Salipaludibacillus sp. HK11]|uniref:hypothetical protein n=1 Tax=Salipaludibacillus sp. HK11 TaxID=3394320 RepID=UPI0039FC48D3
MKLEVELKDLQPSQMFINRSKLRSLIMDGFNAEETDGNPFPVIKFDGELVLIDGHTKAFLADQQGIGKITVEYISEVENLAVYQTCVGLCKQEKITTVADLGKQIISNQDFERAWIKKVEIIKSGLPGKSHG